MTTEFENMKRIWNQQNLQPALSIDEKTLSEYIATKKNKTLHITDITELLLITVNAASGSFVFGTNHSEHSYIFMYLLAAWMFVTALYVLISRVRRIRESNHFDRSMHSDLKHAIFVAAYQVRLSKIMRWNVIPIAAFVMLGMWEGGKSIWISIILLAFFCLTYYASSFEHGMYENRKRDLEGLQKKLES